MTAISWTKHALERSRERGIAPSTVERIVRAPFYLRPAQDGAVELVGRALCDQRWCFVRVIARVDERGGDYLITVVTTY
ncbi:MAG: hypothetical protein CVU56_26075 [Deltaproteobacteria bacterium HGW-Deltaproteobacteria-14]|nr:MAG: hypothetical protein CVU56_26075 [Deltaproteobacteria bacterium HGW-Deltaproteobacteria-14]